MTLGPVRGWAGDGSADSLGRVRRAPVQGDGVAAVMITGHTEGSDPVETMSGLVRARFLTVRGRGTDMEREKTRMNLVVWHQSWRPRHEVMFSNIGDIEIDAEVNVCVSGFSRETEAVRCACACACVRVCVCACVVYCKK